MNKSICISVYFVLCMQNWDCGPRGNMPYLVRCTTARHSHCTTGQLVWQCFNHDLGRITRHRHLGLQTFTIWAPMSRKSLSWQLAPRVVMSPSAVRPLKRTNLCGPREITAFTRLVMTVQTVGRLIYNPFVYPETDLTLSYWASNNSLQWAWLANVSRLFCAIGRTMHILQCFF